jgi:ABC-type Fe2+-enterobactin transport system substrate-binding protein
LIQLIVSLVKLAAHAPVCAVASTSMNKVFKDDEPFFEADEI